MKCHQIWECARTGTVSRTMCEETLTAAWMDNPFEHTLFFTLVKGED